MKIPLVPMEATRDYYKNSWHMGCGVKPLLDETTLKFATEWANVVLKQASGFVTSTPNSSYWRKSAS